MIQRLLSLALALVPAAAAQDGPDMPAAPSQSAPSRSPADARFSVARQAYQQRNFPRAEQEGLAALEQDPKRADIHAFLGAVRYRMRRYGDSIESWKKAVELDPKWFAEAQPAGHCYSALGKHEEAVAWYKKVLAAKPTNREALRGIGITLEKLGQLDDSEKYLRSAVAIDPEYAPALLALGRTLIKKDEAGAAVPYLEKAKQIDPFEPDIEYELSLAFRELGMDAKARAASDRQKTLQSQRTTIDTLRNRLLTAPMDLSAMVALADAYDQMGDVKNARETWDRVFALGREDGRVRAARAMSLLQQGSAQTAEKLLMEWLRTHGTDVPAWDALWFVRKQRGNVEGAEEAAAFVRKLAQREPQEPKLPKLEITKPASSPASAPAPGADK
ncbi:MAG: tetratricopeptide repeat protein [Planctomycetes bacterium]|nr:tetratricopeptide repeat protein [Planctomycetota bacterium]